MSPPPGPLMPLRRVLASCTVLRHSSCLLLRPPSGLCHQGSPASHTFVETPPHILLHSDYPAFLSVFSGRYHALQPWPLLSPSTTAGMGPLKVLQQNLGRRPLVVLGISCPCSRLKYQATDRTMSRHQAGHFWLS